MFVIAAFGLIAIFFATYQAQKAWGFGMALGTFFLLLLINMIPYFGALIVIAAGAYIYNQASTKVMDDRVTPESPKPDKSSGWGEPSSSQPDAPEQIEKLKQLRDDGALSEDEFAEKKQELLDEV